MSWHVYYRGFRLVDRQRVVCTTSHRPGRVWTRTVQRLLIGRQTSSHSDAIGACISGIKVRTLYFKPRRLCLGFSLVLSHSDVNGLGVSGHARYGATEYYYIQYTHTHAHMRAHTHTHTHTQIEREKRGGKHKTLRSKCGVASYWTRICFCFDYHIWNST
jgi:hypothetical protein